MATITRMAADLSIDELARLESLLGCKLQNIPDRHLPTLMIADILNQTPKALFIPTIPPDIQLSFFLRHRSIINRDDERPIKDEQKQPPKITRAIFFYHLSETHQFQRFHDTSRWNLALFTALLSVPTPTPRSLARVRHSRQSQAPLSKTEHITPAARRFMTSYIAAVMERHNTPTVFDKREEFVSRWKESRWDLFVRFQAAQKKLLKREMQRLNKEWERELDRAMEIMGRRQYDARVAPFVGSIIPGRKDQGPPPKVYEDVRDFTRSASPSPEAREDMDMDQHESGEGRNELLEALRVPLEARDYQKDDKSEEVNAPADIRHAIASMQNVRPTDMLPALMRLFPVEVPKRKSRWGSDLEQNDMGMGEKV